jgi:hypothetical protein
MTKKNQPLNSPKINLAIILLLLTYFTRSPVAQAISPAPDGGYQGGNTAEGQNALFSLTTGGFNTAVGYLSLHTAATASFNTGVGAGALFATTGVQNTATGAGALLSNVNGTGNTADGAFALFSNTTAANNTAVGDDALFSNTGAGNTAVGMAALPSNTTGGDNTAVGNLALQSNTSGGLNVAVGAFAGTNLTTGFNNIDIGYNVPGIADESNTIRIGDTDITDTYIRGISGATTSGGAAVFVNGNGKLGTMTSSARFKEDIQPMDKASEGILALRPVRFRYKMEIDPQRIPQFGLVAEDVEKVNPDLVIRDAQGKPQTVRYEQINAMLLNEFLKQHQKVQEQQAAIAELKCGMTALAETVKEQAGEIQRVGAQLRLCKPAAQIVEDDQ